MQKTEASFEDHKVEYKAGRFVVFPLHDGGYVKNEKLNNRAVNIILDDEEHAS
jgi:hypothetical protein